MPAPMELMRDNMSEVDRLMDFHTRLGGVGPGRRYDIEVLNKSAIVLITACWEALVEDLASEGFDFLLKHAKDADVIPARVRTLASKELKESLDDTRIWELSGQGWKKVLVDHRERTINRLVGSLNTPRAENVDRLFNDTLGIKSVSSSWSWGIINADRAREKLSNFVTLRGSIAHRVSTAGSVTKAKVTDYRDFAYRLGVKTTNRVNSHIYKLVGEHPWGHWRFGSTS